MSAAAVAIFRKPIAPVPCPASEVRDTVLLHIACLRRRIIGLEPDGGDDTARLLQHFASVVPMDGDRGVADRRSEHCGKTIEIGLVNFPLLIDRSMGFQQ